MDILIYLLIVGLGVAAGESASHDDYSYSDSGSYSDNGGSDGGFGMSDDSGSDDSIGTDESDTDGDGSDMSMMMEDQTPTGKMTTTTEVKPILTTTKDSWVAVRAYDGHDLLYFTNLLAWRCGLLEIGYSVNDEIPVILEMEPCHTEDASPNAMTSDSFLPYVEFPEGSIQSIHVTLQYDDYSLDEAWYERSEVEMQ